MIGLLLLGLLPLSGCERLNPSWCSTQGRCESGQVCNPTTNTCESHDATPDILSHADFPRDDAPGDADTGDLSHDARQEHDSVLDSALNVLDLTIPD